jgi:leader peptidase (prepilin peptidase)/N-methyltransferase
LRYFLVELISASVFLLFYSLYGLSFHFIFYTLFTCLLIIATFVDIAHRIIPDEVSIGGIVIGFLLSVIRNSMQPDWFRFEGSIFNISSIFNFISSIFIFIFNQPPALDSLFGILLGGGIIYFTGKGFDWIWFKRLKRPPIDGESESMGGGDVKLLAMIGAFLGCKIAVLTFFMAPFFGAIVGIANLITKKQHTIPYGPFLSLAAFISLFWADAILRLIFFR